MNTDDEPQTRPEITAPAYSFSRFDGNGLFKLQRNFDYWEDAQNNLMLDLSNEAIASFKLAPSDSANIDVGTVICQYKFLTYQPNGYYVANGSSADGMAFNDTVGVYWSMAGNPSFGIPSILYTTQKPMPIYFGVTNFSMPSTMARNTGFQIPLGANIKNADSVLVSLKVGEKSVMKMVGGSSGSCSFSNTELSSLPSSNGKNALLQVSPINYDVTLAGARKVYIANQASYTKIVEVK